MVRMAGGLRLRFLHASLVWLLFAQALAATNTPSSTALQQARECMLLGGHLDLFRDHGVEPHVPQCIYTDCPQGSEKAFGSCVNPELPGQAREIALTLHSPCTSCAADGGVELAGRLWVALAAALQVPLQEIQVSMLLMCDVLWRDYPLQHFTLQKSSEGPLVTPYGGVLQAAAIDSGYRWDFFMAVRVHTSRIDPGDPKYLELMALHPSPLLEATGWSDGIHVFEIVQHKTSQVPPLSSLSSAFKIRGHAWGEEPPTDLPDGGSSNPTGSGGDPKNSGNILQTTAHPSRSDMDASTTGVAEETSPVPAPAGCECRTAWLGDGFCDDICNNEVCGWDRGDCGPVPSQAQTGSSEGQEQEVKWPNGYYSPSTSEWESWHVGSDAGNIQGNRGPVIGMNANGEGPLHVQAAQEDGESWWADEPPKEYAESQGVSPLVIGGLCILGCCVPIVCFFARKNPRKDGGEDRRTGWAIGHGFDGSVDDEEKGQRNLSKFSARTWTSQFSEETTDTGGSSPSDSFGLGSKEPKVYPEPAHPDLEDFRASRGDWRNPRSHGPRPEGPRDAARDWQVPHVPGQPNCWYQKQEEERQRRQREKEEQRKTHREQTRAEQDAWQQDWIKNKRGQDKIDKERKRQEEDNKRQQQEKETAQKQQEEAERQRKRQEEDIWKKKEEELHRKAQKEAEAERAERVERQKRDEQRKQQEARQREKEAQQRRAAEQQREAQRKKQREAHAKQQKKDSSGEETRGGFFGRWGRARSEPPKETRQKADAGHQWTKWPGASPPSESKEDKARKAKENAERIAKERQQEAAEKKATSLMDSVMKQIDGTRNAPLEERKKVFKDLQRQLHPDKNPQDQEAAKLPVQKLMENRNVYLS